MTTPAAGPAAAGSELRVGLAAALGCYALWGLFPLLFSTVAATGPVEVIAHRALWSMVFVAAALAVTGRYGEVGAALANPRALRGLVASALLLSGNWLIFVWAVANGRVLEISFGYFINPLVYVALGMVFLGERQNRAQWLAIGIAIVAVGIQAVGVGGVPLVSLGLAFSFGFYAYVRKTVPAGSAPGFFVETLVMLPVALAAVGYAMATSGPGLMGRAEYLWLVLIGAATALALILFAFAARQLRLTTLGVVQYLAPSMQFLTAIVIFGEPLDAIRLLSFVLIWVSLFVFTWDSWRRQRAPAPVEAAGIRGIE